MEIQLSSIAFGLSTFGLTILEVKRYNNLITPFTVTAIPLAIISLMVNFIFIHTDVMPLTMRVNLFLILLTFIIWTTGFIVSNFIDRSHHKIDYYEVFSILESNRNLLIILAVVISFITFWKVNSLVSANGGWLYIGTEDFERKMSTGPAAHLIVFGEAVFILLFLVSAKSKHKFIAYFALFLLGVSIFLVMVKYNFLWMIMMVFFIQNLQNPINIQLRKLLKIALILSSVFIFHFMFLTFFWQTFSIGKAWMWEYFYKTLINYFLTGPIILDSWLNTPGVKPDWTIFIVFFNYLNVILGNPSRISALNYVNNGFTSVIPGVSSNVGTSFGVYYLIGGIPFSLFMTVIVAAFGYLFYIKGLRTGNMFLIFMNCFFLAISTLSFFGQYFTLLPFYEFPFFFILLTLTLKGLNYLRTL